MTRRITISLPDDVADYAEQSGNNRSRFIADVLRRRMRTDSLRARWAERGYVVTDADVERTRARLAALPPIGDEKHARNLVWLEQFDRDAELA
jgi:metal-responsive CopG/Arc/MetJ family transcriptional regulator